MGLLSTFGAASGRAYGFTRSAIAAATDAFFNRVTLLLPGNGTNGAQNNTFLDSSSNNFTITRNGNTTQGTFSPFSQTGWSVECANTGDKYVSVTSTSALNQSGDFTYEAWVYLTETPAGSFSVYGFELTNFLKLAINTSLKLVADAANVGPQATSTNSIALNTWTHVAMVRSGSSTNNVKLYINGVQEAQGTYTTNTTVSGSADIGRTGNFQLTGFISNVRVTNNAVYTSGFTPSTTSLTAISGTQLLTCQSNRFIDNSSNALTVASVGSASIQAFSPFAPTAAYSAATVGGSGYFDGTGDYLSVADNVAFQLGSGSFCIEAWFYPTSTGDQVIISKWGSPDSNSAYEIIYFSQVLYCQVASSSTVTSLTSSITTANWPINRWNHIAFVRSGNTISAYLNGDRFATNAAYSSTINAGNNGVSVGVRAGGSSYPFVGYISNARIVKGSSIYDPSQSTITIPTAPFANVTNTSFLLNFTNAGITDATAKNDLETVGNAQISTTQSKFGGSSMYFDGTGDYLVTPSSENFTLSGDFTIEGWAYRAASGNYRLFTVGDTFTTSGGPSGIEIYVSGTPTGSWVVYSNSATRITGASATRETWTHLALVRSGSTVTLYVNGTASGSTWTSSATFSGRCYVGAEFFNGSVTSDTNGYIDDFRITKFARYTTTFTPPTAAFALQ